MPTTSITIGDYVSVTSDSYSGEGRAIAFEGGLFAVEHDDDDGVTWHSYDEVEAV